jgi:ribosomal protein S12 methylthiotransferase accessory factor
MNRRKRAQRHDSKDVLRFAPNFTVYVLPSDVVCLYSEDRKFFLHGALYCALAAAIGKNGRTSRELVARLEKDFPSEKIGEAIKRLIDRRFVVAKTRVSAGTVGAYWASLGLSPESAAQALQKLSLCIQAVEVEGAAELEKALRALGARVVKRNGDLTITLVSDYLDARLPALNRRHLSDRTPWLLAQPSGIFPLVGPVFRPGNGACWTCLSERMRRNREIKALLDGASARLVAVSPLARNSLGTRGIEMAAMEIAKAIATEFRTDLGDHIISLDLTGSTIARHYVARRPQCPDCGRSELRDPGRAPAPIKLDDAARLVTTSGGYRSVLPAATVARFRKHVSPLSGVVSRLERINADLPLNTNYLATHNFSSRPKTLDELRAGLAGGSFGKGSTAEQGEASALMEAIERYCGIFQGDEIRASRGFAEFAAKEAIHPNEVLLYSDAQMRQYALIPDGDHSHMLAPAFEQESKIEWSPLWSLRDQRLRYLPTTILYFFYSGPGGYRVHADSNGCAAGNTLAEAIVQGFLELVERDAYAIWWYNRVQRPQLDLSEFDDPYIRDLKFQLAQTGREVWVLDITSDLGIPSFVTVAHWTQDGQELVEFGSGAHFDPRIAVLRAMTELSQFLAIGLIGGRTQNPVNEQESHGQGPPPFRLQDHAYLVPHGRAEARANGTGEFAQLAAAEQVTQCVDVARRAGLDFLVLDQTRPDVEVPVVRVVVPGLRHFYRRFAPGRLYDVPVMLRWRERHLSEDELNPFHPQT